MAFYHDYIEVEDNNKVTNLTVDLSTNLSRPGDLPEVRIDEIFAERNSDRRRERESTGQR